MCMGRPRIEECLPRDVLEEVMGCLDRESLCTARLVSKPFCAAAAPHVSSLSVPSICGAVSFHRSPHLGHLTVTHSYMNDEDQRELLTHLDPRLRGLATALRIGNSSATVAQTKEYLTQAALMPQLRKLEVIGGVENEVALLARCTNLEAIRFGCCATSFAKTLVTMRQLTSIRIGAVLQENSHELTVDGSWLGHATILRNLQALRIPIYDEAMALIGNVTCLTGLTLLDPYPFFIEVWTASIRPLTRLSRLRSLRIGRGLTESNLGIACRLGVGSLVNLEFSPCVEVSAEFGRSLSCQTALLRLSLALQQHHNLRQIRTLRIELLQCLKVESVGMLDAEGLSVLTRATSLTKLCITTCASQPNVGWTEVLARLTQLRSLKLTTWLVSFLGDDSTNFLDLPLALSPLTALTKLVIHWPGLDAGVLGALLLLTGLRVLDLDCPSLTDDMLPQLGALTNLRTLKFRPWSPTSLAHISEAIDPLRKARGLPPLITAS